jgi:hypothetical protein
MRRAIRAPLKTGIFALVATFSGTCCIALAGQLATPYIDPAYFLNVPFGTHSHWAQPWRAYLETVPASVFVNGPGINFNVDSRQADDVAAMLAKHRIRHARIEINWNAFDYDQEDRLVSPHGIAREA